MTSPYGDYDDWPDMVTPRNMSRLLTMFPESKLLRLMQTTVGSPERSAEWAALGVTNPVQIAELEIELDAMINTLAKKREHGIL